MDASTLKMLYPALDDAGVAKVISIFTACDGMKAAINEVVKDEANRNVLLSQVANLAKTIAEIGVVYGPK